MVEIDNSKKNIIILFVSMIIILFFIYKGFIVDANLYLQEYKNYILSINTSNIYLSKIKRKKLNEINKDKNKNKKDKDSEKTKDFLIKIKEFTNKSIHNSNDILKYLNNINYKEINKMKKAINNVKDLTKNINQYNEYILDAINNYINNSLNKH